MFPDLKLEPVYFLNAGNTTSNFFVPVLKNAVSYDRVSAYFSAKSLATYAEGLEFFGREGHCYRLIISKDITEEDYREIKNGYRIKESISQDMISALKQNLSLKEEKNISNLAYLISLGVIDIRIAFKTEGIFHDKGGIFTDNEGNKISFRGSNNETEAAATRNYESFSIFCSWLDCNGFYMKGIRASENEFDLLWNNKKENITVLPAQDVVIKEVMKHNKGKIIVEEAFLEKNALILDYDEGLKLWLNVDEDEWFFKSFVYKVFLKKSIIDYRNHVFSFNKNLSYIDFLNIEKRIQGLKLPPGCVFITTQRFRDYIEEKNLHIEERRKLGTELKNESDRYEKQFEEFVRVINQHMSRKLRSKQLRDAFFMLAMQKAGNFSVPGSGKTTSVLAVYCYLKQKGLVDKILVLGPKNCFKSWQDEFAICFDGKESLRTLDIQLFRQSKNSAEIKSYLRYDVCNHNLLLFNYEILASYEKDLSEIVKKKTLLVLDEVHRVKKIDGEYATHVLNIAKESNITIALTGTPIPNSYKDLYNFLHILFPNEYRNFFNFSKTFLSNPSSQDIEIINRKIQPFFCRTTKEQLLVPPPNDDVIEMCNAPQAEQKIFEILCKKYQRNRLALLVRILQLETNPKLLLEKLDLSEFSDILDISDDIDAIDYVDYSDDVKQCIDSVSKTSKKALCLSLAKSLVDAGKPVIIWCIFLDSIESICAELNNYGVKARFIYGQTDQRERDSILDSFKRKEIDVLVTNPHTLAESVSLHRACHDAIYYEYSYNLVHLLQSKDRIHRLGLPDGQYTQYYYLENWYDKSGSLFSLDDAIYRRLHEKEAIMLNAIDNNVLEKVTTPEEDVELIFKGLFS